MNIVVEDVVFQSSDGINKVSGVIYSPDTDDIKGIVQIVHGMAEHMLRYEHFARFLCSKSFVVFGCDHIGHGRSVSSNENLGYVGHGNGCDIMVDDCKKMNEILKNRHPSIPFFILGHSMGSFILRKYITKYSSGLSGVIISGTGGANPLAKLGIMLATKDTKKNGDRNRSKFLDKLAFGNYNKLISKPRTSFDWLTSNHDIVEKYVDDDLCGYIFTSSLFASLLRIMYEVNEDAWYLDVPKRLPIFMISGSDDPVGNYGKGVKTVYDKLKGIGVKDVKLKLYDKGRHEMLNEMARDEVYTDILSWIENL